MRKLKVIVGCECSGRVAIAFAQLGHEAISCDLKRGEAGSVKFKNGGSYKHVQGDVFDIVNSGFDLGVFHPPCTFVASSGLAWINSPLYPNRRKEMADAVEFAKKIWRLPIKHIAMENPVGVLSTYSTNGFFSEIGKPTQIIQPWMFGDEFTKATCLWLKNLPQLVATNVVSEGEMHEYVDKRGKRQRRATWNSNAKHEDRETIRSRTFQGIASAMANQWSGFILGLNEFSGMFLV